MSGLNAARILVTRPAMQADNLCFLIEQHGGAAIRFPTLEIFEVSPKSDDLTAAISSDWLIFTSSNAVDFAIKAFNGKMPELKQFHTAAVGQGTANALLHANWTVDCVPASEFNSEGLLAEPLLQAVAGKVCTIVRGVGGREKLAATLHERGAEVRYLEVYKRCQPCADSTELTACLAERQLAVVTVTSVEALHNLLAMLHAVSHPILKDIPLVVVSERIREIAEQLGFKQIAVSKQPSDTAILETLTTLFNGENSGRSN